MARRSTTERSRAWVKSDSSGVGVVVDEVKTGGNAENSGTPRRDMVRGWDDVGDTQGIAQKS